MVNRGENQFVRMPKIGAKLYDKMMQKKPMQIQRVQIAEELLKNLKRGKILDVGTGHGRLLAEIQKLNPDIELYGIDISEKMIELAKANLKEFTVDLRYANITNTPFENSFFDIVTCTGSLYMWNSPVESLNEIYRILLPEGRGLLFESHKEFDKKELKKLVKMNLKNESFIGRKMIPSFLYKQLRMTYEIKELENLIRKSSFSDNFSIEKITLANLPIWLKIELRKN